MKKISCVRSIVLLVLVVPTLAWGELGGNAASVRTDQVRMKASVMRAAPTDPNFNVQQSQTPSGVTIKEYLSISGTVFAVSWHGPLMPNLKQLLGQYFTNYVTAAKHSRSGHNHLGIQQADLVVHTGGHLRAFSGIAYIPSLMPAGVTVAQLK